MISATLQSYVFDVFEEEARLLLPSLTPAATGFRDTYNRSGNPSADNIKRLFFRLGAPDVLSGLSWQRCPNDLVRSRLLKLNHLRNQCAHGSTQITVEGAPYQLRKSEVQTLRNFAYAFGQRFQEHANTALN